VFTNAQAILFIAAAAMFVGMLGFQLLGHRVGARRIARNPSAAGGTSAIEASLFGLLGLFVAFTLSGAETRLHERRLLIVEEANAIETAYLRLDMLPAASQPPLREGFRRYVEARIAFYERLSDPSAFGAARQPAVELQRQIWREAVVAARPVDTAGRTLLFTALNAMIDISTARDQTLRTHIPLVVLVLLLLMAFACAFFAGLDMAKHRRVSRLHAIFFASILGVTSFVILNLEFPRAGFIRFGHFDVLLTEVRAGMGH